MMRIRKGKLEPRLYQEKILARCKEENTLVVLPTGLGKTICALMLAFCRLEEHPNSKVLFLVPTKPLANQHKKTFSEILEGYEKGDLAVLTGSISPKQRRRIWDIARIIFATSQTIENDLRGRRIELEDVSLVIFDEAHRASKRYSYVYVARRYLKEARNPRVLALTASPGYDKERIERICRNLGITRIEARGEEDEDVLPWVKEKIIEKVFVQFPPELKEIRNLFKSSLKKRLEKLRQMNAIQSIRVTKKKLLELQKKASKKIKRHPRYYHVVSHLAASIKVMHAIELLETQGIFPLKEYLSRLTRQDSRASKSLIEEREFREAMMKINSLAEQGYEHPKFSLLKSILSKEFSPGKKFIVFTQFRDTASKLVEGLKSFKPVKFIGQAGMDGLTQEEQIEILKKFERGEYLTLVATAIGEEGLHIPSVDVAIFFEPIPSALRSVQRRGRVGRTKIGKVYVLITKGTMDEGYYWISYRRERRMRALIDELNLKLRFEQQRRLAEYAPESIKG
jgi:Fanconi anemia group M protein